MVEPVCKFECMHIHINHANCPVTAIQIESLKLLINISHPIKLVLNLHDHACF